MIVEKKKRLAFILELLKVDKYRKKSVVLALTSSQLQKKKKSIIENILLNITQNLRRLQILEYKAIHCYASFKLTLKI